MSISLVVVSRNRPEFLERLFDYYARQRFGGSLFLGDASADRLAGAVARLPELYRGRLDIRLTTYAEGTPVLDRMVAELAKVSTRNVAWVGDDDFLVSGRLDDAVAIFDREPGCSAVVGRGMLFGVKNDTARGQITAFSEYAQFGYEGGSASARLAQFVGNPCALTFAVRRTELAARIWRELANLPWPEEAYFHVFFEMIEAMMTVISGRIEKLGRLMLFRQTHHQSTSVSSRDTRNVCKFATANEFGEFFESMAALLGRELTQNGIGQHGAPAEQIARACLWTRVGGMLHRTAKRELDGVSGHGRPTVTRSTSGWMFGARRAVSLVKRCAMLGASDFRELLALKRVIESSAPN